MIQEGEKAPDFTLPVDGGGTLTLSEQEGKKVVLYFYPKDDTPGCTTQACNLRDDYSEILAAGAIVIGVSPDDLASHDKFKKKYDLPFPLLSDVDHAVAETYGAWGEKKMFGKTYMGIIRSTVIIDEDGTIIKHFPRVQPKTHNEKVLKVLNA
jgi:peroxiredoxin Q/BCP